MGTGRHVRRTSGCVEATGLATARNRRPGSRAGAAGKAIVKHPWTPRRTKDGERTRKEATARESGHGSPGRESSGGAAPGREPSETRRGGVGRTGRGSGRSSSHQTGARRMSDPAHEPHERRTRPGQPVGRRRNSRALERTEPHEGSSRDSTPRDEGPPRKTPRSSRRRGGSTQADTGATRRALSRP